MQVFQVNHVFLIQQNKSRVLKNFQCTLSFGAKAFNKMKDFFHVSSSKITYINHTGEKYRQGTGIYV
jgi:hypothetical protein